MKSTDKPLSDLPEVLTIPEVAALFRMSRSVAYDYARRDAFPVPVIRCGRRMYVAKASLLRLLQSCPHAEES